MKNIHALTIASLGLLGSSTVLAGPVRCSPGYQDSTCVGMIWNAPQVAPTCSTDAGWTTVAAARWIGSRYSAPQCSYQAPPTCGAGLTQAQPPVWNGAEWVGLACNPLPSGASPTEQAVATCASAASGGSIMVMGMGSSRRYLAASQFTQYVPFAQIQWGGAYTNWKWPTYSLGDYPTNLIHNAVAYLQLPISAQHTNTWYAATYTGPNFYNDIGNIFNGYSTLCGIDANGNLAGIIQMPSAPSTSLNE